MKKKKVVMFGLLLLIGAAGVFGYNKFMAGGEAGLSDGRDPVFVSMDPILAPVLQNRQFAGYVALLIDLEVADKDTARMLRGKRPLLRDAFLRDLVFQAQLRREGEPTINLPRVKARFFVLTERIIGPKVVTDILIQSALDRPVIR